MQLGMIGLGRMGNGMTERLREAGHDIQTYDPQVESRTASSLEELKEQLDARMVGTVIVRAEIPGPRDPRNRLAVTRRILADIERAQGEAERRNPAKDIGQAAGRR